MTLGIKECCKGDHAFESPGGPGDAYFYDVPQSDRDPVRVRARLLRGLADIGFAIEHLALKV